MNHLFAYGTLMRGGGRSSLLKRVVRVEPATTTGRLYHLRFGYPVIVDVDEGVVHGELVEIDRLDSQLVTIDEYEGELYRRVPRVVWRANGEEARAWCYVVGAADETMLVTDGARLVPSGIWMSVIQENR